MDALELTEAAAAWELRSAWAARWEVGLTLRRGAKRLRGYVQSVAPSGACAWLWTGDSEILVPCELVAAVARPHFHEPAWGEPVLPPPVRPRLALMPGQLSFDFSSILE